MPHASDPLPDLGVTTTKDVIRDALTRAGRPLRGQRVLDLGTGNGALVRWLLREGADAFGLDADAQLLQAGLADEQRPAPTGRWIGGSAERLPLCPQSLDTVLFLNSLHHVSPSRQVAALAEAARVLRPGGALLVIEPVAAGSFFELLAPLDDETEVRAMAQAALAATRGRFLRLLEAAQFTTTIVFPDVASVIDSFTRADPRRAGAARAALPVIRERFAALGLTEPDGRQRFVQPMTLHHLTSLLDSAINI